LRQKKSIAICLAMFLLFLTACGTGTPSSTQQPSSTPQSSPKSSEKASVGESSEPESELKPIEVSVATWDIALGFPDDGTTDPLYDFIKKKFNITIVPKNVTWDDYSEKIQLWAAGGQLPDVFTIDAQGRPFLSTWIKEGLVRPIPDDLSAFPTLNALMQTEVYTTYKHDGHYYGLPKPNFNADLDRSADKAIYYRKDWMEAVGITKIPDSTEEFITLVNAFNEKDPEGTKPVGATAYSIGHLLTMMFSYLPGMGAGGNSWILEDGKWTLSLFQKDALPAIKEAKKLFDAGAIDRDVTIVKGNEGIDKFASGRSGVLFYGGTPDYAKRLMDVFNKTYPGKNFYDIVTVTHPWKSLDGNYYVAGTDGPVTENYFNAKTVDDEKMERMLMLSEYLLSPEGSDLISYGLPNVDFTRDGDKVTITREKDDNGEYVNLWKKYPSLNLFGWYATWNATFNYYDPGLPEKGREQALAIRDWAKTNAKPAPQSPAMNALEFEGMDTMAISGGDELIKLMLSKDVDKAYNDMLGKFNKAGLQKYLDNANEAAKAAGITSQRTNW